MLKNPKEEAAQWRETALKTLKTAKHLRERDDYRSCVSRAYYTAYQAATSICILHGDAANFARGWHNPAHEHLPELIDNNGDLALPVRRRVVKHLDNLRALRETADYRMGYTIDAASALTAVKVADNLFNLLEI